MKEFPLPLSLQRVVGRYVRAFAPERVVLFGSYAKQTNRPESDADILIVTRAGEDNSLLLRRAHQLAQGCFPPVDVVFATADEVAVADGCANAKGNGNPFLASIFGTGITLYERPWPTAQAPSPRRIRNRTEFENRVFITICFFSV
jgi:uncharacterized protein